MESEVDIILAADAISVVKENKTSVNYFIFDEYEVHLNRIPPHTIQEWHRHQLIEEVLAITSGEICIKWLENNEVKNNLLRKIQ